MSDYFVELVDAYGNPDDLISMSWEDIANSIASNYNSGEEMWGRIFKPVCVHIHHGKSVSYEWELVPLIVLWDVAEFDENDWKDQTIRLIQPRRVFNNETIPERQLETTGFRIDGRA